MCCLGPRKIPRNIRKFLFAFDGKDIFENERRTKDSPQKVGEVGKILLPLSLMPSEWGFM